MYLACRRRSFISLWGCASPKAVRFPPILLWMVILVSECWIVIDWLICRKHLIYLDFHSYDLVVSWYVYHNSNCDREGRFTVLMPWPLFQSFLVPSRSEMCFLWVWMCECWIVLGNTPRSQMILWLSSPEVTCGILTEVCFQAMCWSMSVSLII